MSNNILKTTDEGVVSDREFTHMVTLFGQWNDHDLTFTPFSPSIRSFSNGVNCDESCERTEPCLSIPVSVRSHSKVSVSPNLTKRVVQFASCVKTPEGMQQY